MAAPTPDAMPPPDAAPPSCLDDGNPFDPAALHARVAALADPALDGRAPGAPGDRTARAIVAERFACLGLTAAFPGYVQRFDDTANLVGFLPGETSEIIVVGAHLDHLGDGHLGANDDASGIAGMLAIAQAIAHHGKPHRTIAFAAFGAEELGMHGSTYFAAHMPDALPMANVVYDVNLDMLGTYASHRAVIALGDFPRQPARAILDRITARRGRLNVVPGGRGVGSDHEPFCALGIPYVFFWTPDARCYHERCDTIANLDDVHLGPIVEVAAQLVTDLATTSFVAQRRLGCDGRTLAQ